jgi:hypothetical protein
MDISVQEKIKSSISELLSEEFGDSEAPENFEFAELNASLPDDDKIIGVKFYYKGNTHYAQISEDGIIDSTPAVVGQSGFFEKKDTEDNTDKADEVEMSELEKAKMDFEKLKAEHDKLMEEYNKMMEELKGYRNKQKSESEDTTTEESGDSEDEKEDDEPTEDGSGEEPTEPDEAKPSADESSDESEIKKSQNILRIEDSIFR